MAGCLPTETLLTCKHGAPVKFGCMACLEEKQREDKLNNGYLIDRVREFSEHKNRQIDENRKVSRRLDEVEKFNDEFKKLAVIEINSAQDHYEKLHDVVLGAEKRLSDLETLIHAETHERGNIWSRLEYLETHYSHESHDKKPHECPVCDGSKRDYFDTLFPISEYPPGIKIDHKSRRYQDCGACEGKGIVWG